MPLPLRMMPVSLRCRHGRCRHRPEPTRTHYGSSRILASSRIITDRPGFFKQFKISKTTSRTFPDRPGPSRTAPDHPEPSRQRYGRVTDRHGSDPRQSVAVRELGVTVGLANSFLMWNVRLRRANLPFVRFLCDVVKGFQTCLTQWMSQSPGSNHSAQVGQIQMPRKLVLYYIH